MDDMSWYRKAGFEAPTTLATKASWLLKIKTGLCHTTRQQESSFKSKRN